MAEKNSADPTKEQSESGSSNVNKKARSNGKNNKNLRGQLSSSNVNKNIPTKRTMFKSSDVLVKSEGSTNTRHSIFKSPEMMYLPEEIEEEELLQQLLPPPPPPPPPPPLPPPRPPPPPDIQTAAPGVSSGVNVGASTSKNTQDDYISDTDDPCYPFVVKRGFKGFSEPLDTGSGEILLDLYDREEIEVIQAQLVKEDGSGLDSPPIKRRRLNEMAVPSSESTSPSLSINSQISILSLVKSKTGSPASKTSRKSSVDLSHPKFLVPFEYGWKREVVTRSVTSREDGISKDVYYFHPAGKKLRSLREVTEKLTPGLSCENFTFYKEPIGAKPLYETVRNARTPGQSPGNGSYQRRTPVRRQRGRCSTVPVFPSGPGSSLPPATPPLSFLRAQRDAAIFAVPQPARRCNRGTPRIALRGPAPTNVNGGQGQFRPPPPRVEGPKPHPDAPAGPRRKITPRKNVSATQTNPTETNPTETNPTETNPTETNPTETNPTETNPTETNPTETNPELTQGADVGEIEMEYLSPFQSLGATSARSSSNESVSWTQNEKRTTEEGEQDYCTIRCTNAMGLIPTLQCSICLCIYHPDCCDMLDITAVCATIRYICENCQAKSREFKERRLVKHITPAVVTCQKSPPIISPRPIHPMLTSPIIPSAPSAPLAPLAPLASMIPQIRPRPTSSRSLRGAPTWTPPTSRVFRSPIIPAPIYQRPEGSSSPPQTIVNLNSKRYIVVPKRSVFSVAPNQNTSPTKPESAMTATIITPTPTSTIIEGPPLKDNPFIRTTNTGPGVCLFPFGAGENPDVDPNSQYLFINPIAGSSATQRSCQPDLPIGSGTLDHFARIRAKLSKRSTAAGVDPSMQRFMRNICIGYTALLNVFQYLKVQELLRAGRVCRLWRDIAGHASLWRTVRMKNSQVSDWKGFTDSLVRYNTKFLDLRKMLVSLDETEEMWATFARYISNVRSLEGMEMCRCSVRVIEQIIESCPQLLIFNAQMIGMKEQLTAQKLKVETITRMRHLEEIRLKSCYGLNLVGSLQTLTSLAGTLTVLSLTSIKNLGWADIHYIGRLRKLEVLELGECTDLPTDFPTVVIAKLQNLKRIRFEKGPARCTTNEMLKEIKNLKDLVQLELINFDIRPGFDEAFAACTNVKRLLLIPTYVTQSATTNHIILSGALKHWKNLTHFVWVITMELMKVTELFVDQCERNPDKKGGGVPVLKPVPRTDVDITEPVIEIRMEENVEGSRNPTPITVIPVDELYDMVRDALPNTRVKLLKIPFQNTWRQTMAEGSV